MKNRDWMDDARCAGTDTESFYPPHGLNAASEEVRYILERFCHRCPVQAECLEDALDTETTRWDRIGIRGGLTANQRGQVAKERATRPAPRTKAICGTLGGHSRHRREKTKICDECKAAVALHQRASRAKQKVGAA